MRLELPALNSADLSHSSKFMFESKLADKAMDFTIKMVELRQLIARTPSVVEFGDELPECIAKLKFDERCRQGLDVADQINVQLTDHWYACMKKIKSISRDLHPTKDAWTSLCLCKDVDTDKLEEAEKCPLLAAVGDFAGHAEQYIKRISTHCKETTQVTYREWHKRNTEDAGSITKATAALHDAKLALAVISTAVKTYARTPPKDKKKRKGKVLTQKTLIEEAGVSKVRPQHCSQCSSHSHLPTSHAVSVTLSGVSWGAACKIRVETCVNEELPLRGSEREASQQQCSETGVTVECV